MQSDPDKELFSRLSRVNDFAKEAIYNDTLEDWSLAKDFGEYLVRTAPQDILGHALLARACRHLGDRTRALEEIQRCQILFTSGELKRMELEVFGPFLERKRLIGGGPYSSGSKCSDLTPRATKASSMVRTTLNSGRECSPMI